jgi:hypothetical protein
MQQTEIKTQPRQRDKTPADPPTINRTMVRTWFSEAQPFAIRNFASMWLSD